MREPEGLRGHDGGKRSGHGGHLAVGRCGSYGTEADSTPAHCPARAAPESVSRGLQSIPLPTCRRVPASPQNCGHRRMGVNGRSAVTATKGDPMTGQIGAKRRQPFVPALLERLRACGELRLQPELAASLRQASVSTLERLLAPARRTTPVGSGLNRGRQPEPGRLLTSPPRRVGNTGRTCGGRTDEQAALATKAGYSREYVARLETGLPDREAGARL